MTTIALYPSVVEKIVFDWYFAGNVFNENGWRPYSPSQVHQGFGKIGWENDRTDIDLSFTYANNSLQGVGPTPQEDLQQNWNAFFSAPGGPTRITT